MKEFLTTAEAAEILQQRYGRFVPGTLKNMCANGDIPGAQRIGSNWAIPKEFIDNFVPARDLSYKMPAFIYQNQVLPADVWESLPSSMPLLYREPRFIFTDRAPRAGDIKIGVVKCDADHRICMVEDGRAAVSKFREPVKYLIGHDLLVGQQFIDYLAEVGCTWEGDMWTVQPPITVYSQYGPKRSPFSKDYVDVMTLTVDKKNIFAQEDFLITGKIYPQPGYLYRGRDVNWHKSKEGLRTMWHDQFLDDRLLFVNLNTCEMEQIRVSEIQYKNHFDCAIFVEATLEEGMGP